MSRRFGQPAATMAGIKNITGDRCVIIDCDLQDPPELIYEMNLKMNEGYDAVLARRKSRKGETCRNTKEIAMRNNRKMQNS